MIRLIGREGDELEIQFPLSNIERETKTVLVLRSFMLSMSLFLIMKSMRTLWFPRLLKVRLYTISFPVRRIHCVGQHH